MPLTQVQVHIFGSQTPIRSLRNRSVSFEENREPLSVTDSVIMGVHQSWNVKRDKQLLTRQTAQADYNHGSHDAQA